MTKTNDDYLNYLENTEKHPWSVYEALRKKISMILQCISVVDNHPDEFDDSLKERMKEYNFPPGTILMEYIIHEIQSFYRLAWINQKTISISEADFPNYQKDKLKVFRDKITGHLEDISIKELIELYRMINIIGVPKILNDFFFFSDKVINNLKSNQNNIS